MLRQLYLPGKDPMRVAALMSGTGSNLRRILEFQQQNPSLLKVVMIFTDTADGEVCKAKEIASEYSVPYYCNDIREYYEKRGHSDRKDMKIREEYDAGTAKLLKMHKADVVALCGYMSIVTGQIIGSFLTLNLHPADLRIMENSKRKYAGCMGADCIKKAMLNGETEVRSTVHLVSGEVDGGKILAVSKPVKIDMVEKTDINEAAHYYHESLKEQGDWKIYPATLKMLAEGRLAQDENGRILLDGRPIPDDVEI